MTGPLIEALGELARAAAMKIVFGAVAGLLFVAGAGFVLAAGYMTLAAKFGAIAAAMSLGVLLLVMGLVVLAVMVDNGSATDHDADAEADTEKRREADEETLIMELLSDAAIAGYATGQGDTNRLRRHFETALQRLALLGAFTPGEGVGSRPAPHEDAPEDTAPDMPPGTEDPATPDTHFPPDPDAPDAPSAPTATDHLAQEARAAGRR